jgi:hypothetical protein
MAIASQPADEPVRPAPSVRHALQQHRQAVAAGSQALQEWTVATADEDRALRERLADIRERLAAALRPPLPKRISPPMRPRLHVVGVAGEYTRASGRKLLCSCHWFDLYRKQHDHPVGVRLR